MKKSYPLALAALSTLLTAQAAPLTPAEALNRVAASADAPAKMKKAAQSAATELTCTYTTAGRNCVYVFGTDNASLIISADDVAMPLLGYTDGRIEADDINPELAYWLQFLSDEIDYYAGCTKIMKVMPRTARAEKAPIAPMLSTLWNQGEPYNLKCPTYTGLRSVTGCVATAMAQVMKYHNYPATGTGSNSYTWSTGQRTLRMDFSKITFDWDNMLDTYTSGYTEEQSNAVAVLMAACGYSTNMQYSANGSGTQSSRIPTALSKYFRYNKSARLEERCYYRTFEWEDLVYENLQAGPVILDGQANVGGHSFVCDGYQGDGFYHINWGWGGTSNGYFRLSALDPYEQGIGGADSGFNYMQDCIAGIKAEEGGEYVPQFVMDDAFELDSDFDTLSPGDTFVIATPIYSLTVGSTEVTFGLRITAGDGSETLMLSSETVSIDYYHGLSNIPFKMTSMPDGVYTVTPVAVVNNKEYLVRGMPMMPTDAVLTISGGQATFDFGSEPIISTQLELKTPVYVGSSLQGFALDLTIENQGDREFYAPGQFALCTINEQNQASIAALTDYFTMDVPANSTVTMPFGTYFTQAYASLTSGEYYMCLLSLFGNQYVILDEVGFVNVEVSQTAPTVTVSNLKPDGADQMSMDKNDLNFKADLSVVSGYVGATLNMYVYTLEGQYMATLPSNFVYASAGETTQVKIHGEMPNGRPNTRYEGRLYLGNTAVATIRFMLSNSSEVTEVEVEDAGTAEYYNLQGVRVDGVKPGVMTPCIKITRNSKGEVTGRHKIILK